MTQDDARRDDWLEQVLRPEREIPAVSAGDADQAFARLQDTLGHLEAGLETTSNAPAAATTAASAATLAQGAWPLALVALGGVAVGAVGGYAVRAAQEPAPIAEQARSSAERPFPSAAPIVAPLLPKAQSAPSQAESPPTAPSVPASGVRRISPAPIRSAETSPLLDTSPRPSAERPDAELADENALITRAQSALARGNTAEALAAAQEHARRYPRGRFSEEREALAIQALARSGQTAAAQTRGERFLRSYPRSLLSRVVRQAAGLP